MRYGVPRSPSPPLRRRIRRTRRSSTFGLQSDSDDDSDSDSGSSSSSSSSSDSFCYKSESEVPLPPSQPRKSTQSPAETRNIEDTIAAIRLRVRHHDPYDEWERQMRRDAFRTARNEQSLLQAKWQDQQGEMRSQESMRLAAAHSRRVAEVQTKLDALDIRWKKEEAQLYETWKERDRKLWERIESVIKEAEDTVKARLEAEHKVKEEAERRKREEEEKKRKEEARRREEEERRRKEEEDRRLEEEIRRALRQADEREEQLKREQSQKEEQALRALGPATAEEDWIHARKTLLELKAGPMKNVKSNKQMKSAWSASRRQITPKVGQLTNDRQAIARISQQLHDILIPPSGSHPPDIYQALLSSLAKAILLQAETEVTAEKRSAGPLAEVTANLLSRLPSFPDILFAKLVQRAGGWPVPSVIPQTQDADGRPWKDEDERLKAMGYRKSSDDMILNENGNGGGGLESTSEYITRVSGMMRVYFAILKVPVSDPEAMGRLFQMPRCWTWFARIMKERGLLETAVAPQVIYVALDELGLEAKALWGQQWMKMLALLREGATTGLGGDGVIGGQRAEGKAAKVRVQVYIPAARVVRSRSLVRPLPGFGESRRWERPMH